MGCRAELYAIGDLFLLNLIFRFVIDDVRKVGTVVDVEFVAAVRPGDKNNFAVLRVEWKIFDIQHTVGLDEGRIHPQHAAVGRYDGIRHHIIVELVSGATM